MLKLNRNAIEFKIEGGDPEENNEEDENVHVFIGYQQPLDLMTQNAPANLNNYYPPANNFMNSSYTQQTQMNFGPGFYPTNNFNYYN